MTEWMPAFVEIHFANGEKKDYSARKWAWEIDGNGITLWEHDMSTKIRYSGNVAIMEYLVPKQQEAKGK